MSICLIGVRLILILGIVRILEIEVLRILLIAAGCGRATTALFAARPCACGY